MTFPDQIHIDKIREALWRHPKPRRGTAAIMVGAGFSRNAFPSSVSSRPMPTWSDLTKKLHGSLYPDATGGSFLATSEALRLAQEYEETHGRYALNKFILDSTPDTDYEPSTLHEKLLKLRWADIFTTNWDTLLERTCRGVPEQYYHIISTTTDISGSSAPRIVKLHGTFPSNMPFIFTEEDYRRYPIDFAPFVNFVQQSMMENVFCLIGFSGDDPNFLHWSGWVRDNLGKTAPKIYFVGWHEIPQVKRRELEKRNIIPIDLANIPGSASWPKAKRHQWAIEWFLENLDKGEPWNKSEWPNDKNAKVSDKADHLKSITSVVENRPLKEHLNLLSHQTPKEEGLKAVRKVISMWEHNRKLYPGWVVAPYGVREQIWRETKNWVWEVIRYGTDSEPWVQLFNLREIVWRLDICLVPIDDNIFKSILKTLGEFDLDNRQCRRDGNIIEWKNPDWARAQEAWTNLATAILRDYREEGKSEAFDSLAKTLETMVEYDDDIRQVLWHQRSLLAIEKLDYDAVDMILKEWNPQHTDHIWALRKAAVLAEMNYSEEARNLASDTLVRIRQGMRKDIDDIAMMSREGWAMFFLQDPFEQKWNDRLNDLAVHKCNANEEFNRILTELRRDPPEYREVTVERRFDLGATTTTRHFSNEWDHKPAYQMIRITEVSGIPPRIELAEHGYMDLSKNALERVAFWIKNIDPLRAIRIVMRVCTYDGDKILESVFRRETVAAIEDEKVSELAFIIKGMVEYSSIRFVNPTAKSTLWIDRLRAAMELLSRFVLRLNSKDSEEILHLVIHLCEQERIRGHLWLAKPLLQLIARTIESIPPSRWKDIVLPLMKMPTTGYPESAKNELWWLKDQDLGSLVEEMSVNRINSPGEWSETIRNLLDSLSSKDRCRAVWRLRFLHLAKVLTEDECKKFANALWKEDLINEYGLPADTGMYPPVLLSLPEPEQGLAEQRLRNTYFVLENAERIKLHEYLYGLALLIRSFTNKDRLFEISLEEKKTIKKRVLEWADEKEENISEIVFDTAETSENKQAISGIGELLPLLEFNDTEFDKIHNRIQLAESNGYPCFTIYPALISKRQALLNDLCTKLREALASEQEDKGAASVDGLWVWLRFAGQIGIQSPPDDLLSEIGIAIYVRRKNILWISLRFAAWMFEKHKELALRLLYDRVIHGLRYLLEETKYGFDRRSKSDQIFDIPLIRKECVKLVLAMKNAELSNEVIDNWLKVAENDPLPEVRYLLGGWDLSD